MEVVSIREAVDGVLNQENQTRYHARFLNDWTWPGSASNWSM